METKRESEDLKIIRENTKTIKFLTEDGIKKAFSVDPGTLGKINDNCNWLLDGWKL